MKKEGGCAFAETHLKNIVFFRFGHSLLEDAKKRKSNQSLWKIMRGILVLFFVFVFCLL